MIVCLRPSVDELLEENRNRSRALDILGNRFSDVSDCYDLFAPAQYLVPSPSSSASHHPYKGRAVIAAELNISDPAPITMNQIDQQSDDHDIRQFFGTLERRRTAALVGRDMQTIEELHAPEYELITPTGRVFTREEYLAAVAQGPFYAGWEANEMNFRISSNMAIVRYKALLRFPSGQELLCWHTDTYERRAGQWQAVWSQATELRVPSSQA